ncbi:MAG TPA: SDR family oxidoreductase [Nitrolancea sp.]|jgi:short-subunit dehydrogenase|nr:SDR family oxidoreductase [Nitrolancea sp.]
MKRRPIVNHSESVLIFGATSAIATEVARLFAATGKTLFLVGRSPEKLEVLRDDLLVRGARKVETYEADLADIDAHQAIIDAARQSLGTLDQVLVAYGVLGDQRASECSVETTLRDWQINATSTIALLTLLGNDLERQHYGTLAVISSVAGDRGRKTNYVYGSAKAAVSAFLSGLRARLSKSGVRVVTIKPGMVDTPMTAHMKKGPLFASPERVGNDIHEAMLRGRDIVYTPWYWRYVMLIIRLIPEPIFKRLPL